MQWKLGYIRVYKFIRSMECLAVDQVLNSHVFRAFAGNKTLSSDSGIVEYETVGPFGDRPTVDRGLFAPLRISALQPLLLLRRAAQGFGYLQAGLMLP